MTGLSIMMFHQGAELYGSDYMFLMSVRSFARSHRVHVVLDSAGPLADLLRQEPIAGLDIVDLAVMRRAALQSPVRAIRYGAAFLTATLRIRRMLRLHRPDVVYANTLGLLAPLVAAAGLGIRCILHLHEIFDRPRKLFRALYTLAEALSDDVVCVSQAVQNHLSRMSLQRGRKGRVVHNGIDCRAVTPPETETLRAELRSAFANPDLPLVAYVARIHYWKGQREFLEVLRLLHDRGETEVNTAFFGAPFADYPTMTTDLAQQARAMGLSGNVGFFGFRPDAHTLFALADLSVMGSVAPDPFPTVVLESMAQGCPVVAYDHGGTAEMIAQGPCGLLAPPGDGAAMARQITRILADPALRTRLSVNARQAVADRFTLHHYAARIGNVLHRR